MYDADGNVLLQRDPSAWTLYLPGEQITLNVSAGTEAGARIIPLPSGGDVVRTGATTSYYFEVPDIRGTSTLYLDNTAQFPTWRQFTPYGAPRGATVSWVDNRAYLNQPADPVTGLTILGARQYNPVTSQFISPDPLLHPTNPQSLNPYVYAADNPETFSDPSGKDSIAAAIVTLLATHPNPTNNATLARVYTACLHHSAAPRLGGSTEPGASGTSPRLPTAYSKIPDFEPPRVTTYPLPPDIGGTIVDPIAPELGINIIFDPLAPDLGQGKEIYPILGPWQTVNYNSNKTWQERVRDALLYIILLTHQGQGDVHSPGQVGKPQTPIESVQFPPAPEQPPGQGPEPDGQEPDPNSTPQP